MHFKYYILQCYMYANTRKFKKLMPFIRKPHPFPHTSASLGKSMRKACETRKSHVIMATSLLHLRNLILGRRFSTQSVFGEVVKESMRERFSALICHERLVESIKGQSVLKALKQAKISSIPFDCEEDPGVRVLKLGTPLLLNYYEAFPDTIFVRDFYSRLFTAIRKNRRSILMGNPGISKSWFQWL